MAYTDPVKTFAFGEKLSSADLNTYLRDNLAFLIRPPMCSMLASGPQSIGSGTGAFLDGTEVYDTNGMHSDVTNPDRITVQTAGRYLGVATIQYASNATGNRSASLEVNGTTLYEGDLGPAANGNSTICSVVRMLTLSQGDYVRARAFQTSGGNLNTTLLELALTFVALV